MASASSENFQYGYPTPGPQSPTGQDVMDHVYFVSNTEWKSIREVEQFDYVVIGTGPCGLAFVERILSHHPQSRILVLERGGYFLPEHFQNLPPAFASTIGGLSETFPWTLSRETATGEYIKFQHGMVPFFGGRSILWSAWCPEPTDEEFIGWPTEVIQAARRYFDPAKKLMNVTPVGSCHHFFGKRKDDNISMSPVYAGLQRELAKSISDNLDKVPTLTRSMDAPLAVGITEIKGIDFQKFATPGPFVDLVQLQEQKEQTKTGKRLKIVNNCIVEQIYHQDSRATALKTSRGVVNIGDAKLILAMGTVPPATLIANSFPDVPEVGKHLCSHLIIAIVARIRVDNLDYGMLNDIELGAVYVAGVADKDHNKQFHVQLSAFHDTDPEANARFSFEFAPDVVATASRQQLETSKGYIVFVLACLGEMDVDNQKNHLTKNNADVNQTTNMLLNLTTNDTDNLLWDVMDNSAFELLEKIISPEDGYGGNKPVQYWHGDADNGEWYEERPPIHQYRVPGTVHESSTLIIGNRDDEKSSVGLDYRPHGVENVYVTGGGLWPRSGSWNPTLTMVALAQDLADNLAGRLEDELDHKQCPK